MCSSKECQSKCIRNAVSSLLVLARDLRTLATPSYFIYVQHQKESGPFHSLARSTRCQSALPCPSHTCLSIWISTSSHQVLCAWSSCGGLWGHWDEPKLLGSVVMCSSAAWGRSRGPCPRHCHDCGAFVERFHRCTYSAVQKCAAEPDTSRAVCAAISIPERRSFE